MSSLESRPSVSPPAGRLRLLVIASTYPRWSSDPEPGFVHELSWRLAEGFDVVALCPHAANSLPVEVMDGVRVVRYRYAPSRLEVLVNGGGIVANLRQSPWKWLLVPGFMLAMLWATWRLIRQYRPHVIHAHWMIPQGLAAAWVVSWFRRKPSLVVTSHGADLFSLRAMPFQLLKRFVARRSTALTVVSESMRKELKFVGANDEKVTVQPMGVDLDDGFTPSPDVVRSKEEILFVGRLVEKKGVRYLLDAMPAILSAHPSANLLIVGFGPELEALRAQCSRMGLGHKVTFAGARTQVELPLLYRRAAVFVSPFVRADNGDVEGLGLVVAEALGCLCPVVVGDVPAVHDLLDDTRWIVDVKSDSLARAVIEVLNDADAAQRRAVAARKRIAERISWGAVTRGYARLLSSAEVDGHSG